MFGLVTMLLSTLGATGMGSILKILGGLVQSISDANEQKAKREMARDLAMSSADIKFQQAVFGNASDPEANLFTRATRRLIALIGMLNFATIPSGGEITSAITTGHISLVSIATLGAIVGFYFTPGGKR
jgi:hypothetical protein